MHGRSLGSALVVNAEVDSMGGIANVGISVDSKTSPRCTAIEKAQAELRKEFDVREERRRELEFLEKGGNPLDFKVGPSKSISVQSTSLTDHLAEHEARDSFSLAASPHGDSVDSSGKPGLALCRESNIADRISLHDSENNVINADRSSSHPGRRRKIPQSAQSLQLDRGLNAKESGESTIFRLGKSQAYARRNRSRSNRDGGHARTINLVQSNHGNGTSLSMPLSNCEPRDVKGSTNHMSNEKEPSSSSFWHSTSASPSGNVGSQILVSDKQLDIEMHAGQCLGARPGNMEVRMPEEGNAANGRDKACYSQTGGLHSDATGLTMQKAVRVLAGAESGPLDVAETEKLDNGKKCSGCNAYHIDCKDLHERENENGVRSTGVDSDSSCLDDVVNVDKCPKLVKNMSTSENSKESLVRFEGKSVVANKGKEIKEPIALHVDDDCTDEFRRVEMKREDTCNGESDMRTAIKTHDHRTSESNGTLDGPLGKDLNAGSAVAKLSSTLMSSNGNLGNDTSFVGLSAPAMPDIQGDLKNKLLVNQADEDTILEKARIIEANRKRLSELSGSSYHAERHKKSHWNFVLEEMAWLADDFMQERLWKRTAAAQMSHWVALGGRLKFCEKNLHQTQKKVAHNLAKAIMEFWRGAEVCRSKHSNEECKSESEVNADESDKGNVEDAIKEQKIGNILEDQSSPGDSSLPIHGYASRFLKYASGFSIHPVPAEAPLTPDRISDSRIWEIPLENQLSQENLFYTVPPGSMEDYRKSVESLWIQYEKFGDSMHKEKHGLSLMESASEYGIQENPYEEEEGESGGFYLPGAFEGTKSSKSAKRKKKTLPKSYAARPYDGASDYAHCMENRLGSQSAVMGKRPSSALNVGSIPTKRVRTAARQRPVSPFVIGGVPGVQIATKNDVSSGDTSSIQDDQSSLYGGSQLRRSSELESTGEFGRQLSFDGTEISPKAKKRKKTKHFGYRSSVNSMVPGGFALSGRGSTSEQCFQADAVSPHEQRELLKRKAEARQCESNGNIGIYGFHTTKKAKLLRQPSDASPEAIGPTSASFPSPVASQISNMSNPTRLIKIIPNRAPGRKVKALKMMPAAPASSGSPWSILEDQALVVLVHDMGPNWELVSDAMNSTLHFKSTYRKPKECKERHKILMDLRNSGDGADSAEDSGSSQPYPSTIPGIPKGSAQQLFQRLQGPMEEEMLKAHFEKIIVIAQQLHARRIQNDNQEGKQLTPAHSSHFRATSQGCSNNSNSVATALDLCDEIGLNQDVHSLGYLGSHPSTLAVSNDQSPVGPVVHTSGTSSMVQGTTAMLLSSGLPASAAAVNPSPRDAQRYGAARSPSLPGDEQQRLQQYGQMVPSRNVQQPAMSSSGAFQPGNERGVRMLPGGNGLGMMCGMSRGMGTPRPGFQGVGSPTLLNMVSSGGVISSAGAGLQNPVNMNMAPVSDQASCVPKPRDAMTMTRPGQSAEDRRHLMVQDLHIQVPQVNGQAVSAPFSGLSSAYSSQTVPPPVQNFSMQHSHQTSQQPHVLSSPHHPHLQGPSQSTAQQQAYAFRLAKERQLQQRLLQQHQFPSPPSIPHAHQSLSPVQNGAQSSGSPSSLPLASSQHPMSPSSSPLNSITLQVQPKHSHGLIRNSPSGVVPSQILKQRPRPQQFQQQQQQQHLQRPHLLSRQQSHSQQQATLIKGSGRGGSVMIHQNFPMEPTHVSGLTPGNPGPEKSEPVTQMMQSQGLYSGSGSVSNLIQPGKQLGPQSPNPGSQQQKVYPHLPSKQLLQTPSHIDASNKTLPTQVPSSHALLPNQQCVPSSPLARQSSQLQLSAQSTLPHGNHQIGSSDASLQNRTDHGNPIVSMPSVSECMNTSDLDPAVNSSATSPSQWNMEPALFDPSTSTPGQLKNAGNSLLPTSAGPDLGPTLVQRQVSVGAIPMHGPNVGSQWQQHPQPLQQQQQQLPQQLPLHHQRHASQGNLCTRQSNSGPG